MVLALGCSETPRVQGDGQPPEAVEVVAQSISSIDCAESQDTGYTSGTPFSITVVTVDGKKAERETANAYYVMAQAAEADGVELRVVSGFRTMSEQEYLYGCYVNCNCNNCNLAATPGYSNHQSGHALDLNTSASGVLTWLNANAASFGFERTVPSENWHWEWWGGGPGGGPCGDGYFAGESLGVDGQSFPVSSAGAVTVELGQTVTGWLKLRNTGTAPWEPGSVWLAPMPRDQASPFQSPSWLNGHRISSVGTVVAPGEVGEFALDITGGGELGESSLLLGWVAEGITWFADAGGPPDGYFEVRVNVVPATTQPGAGGAAAGGAGTSTGGVPAGVGGTGGNSQEPGPWAGMAGATGAPAAGGTSPAGTGGAGLALGPDSRRSSGDDSGCSVHAPGSSAPGAMAWLLLGLVGLHRRQKPGLAKLV